MKLKLHRSPKPRQPRRSRSRASGKKFAATCRSAHSRARKLPRRNRRRKNPRILLRLSARAVSKGNSAAKLDPSFESLDFPDRQVLYPFELAARLGCSSRHIHDLILDGELRAIDLSGRGSFSGRKYIRIPIESWRQFLRKRMI